MSVEAILLNGQTWLICGGRDFAHEGTFNGAMRQIIELRGCPEKIVQGGAPGADTMAAHWGEKMGLSVVAEVSDWGSHGNAAGPIRNQKMIDDHKPDVVIAFPGGRGTADMVRRAREAKIEVIEITLHIHR